MSALTAGPLARMRAISDDQTASLASKKPKVNYPTGWEPTVKILDDSEGNAVSDVFVESSVDEAALLEGWLLDPEDWQIVPGTLLVNRWMGYPKDGENVWLYQFKAKVIRKAAAFHANVDEIFKVIKGHKARKRPVGGGALVINLSDWQIGKGEGGGTEATVDRILESFDRIEQRIRNLRKAGWEIGTIYVIGMGDLVERCANNYSTQTFTVDLNEREQERVVRRLLLEIVIRAARLAEAVIITSVGGNHGEARNGSSRSYTDDSDNLDVGVFETVAEALALNPEAYGHVKFYLPDDELVVALDINGLNVAFSHGHLGKKGANPTAKALNWWEGQTFGRHAAADAEVLVTAHYHHFACSETHGRLWLQCPSQDGGSKWFRDATGQHSRAGTLTFMVDDSGLCNIEVV